MPETCPKTAATILTEEMAGPLTANTKWWVQYIQSTKDVPQMHKTG